MYAKLFTSLYQGTLRGNSKGILVFTNLLAHADKNGDVDIHPRAIAEEVGLSVEIVNETLLMLESEDPESRSPECEGRRIVRLDEHRSWGWNIVNFQKYRAIRNEEDRREQSRIAQEKFRNKHKDYSNKSKPRVSQVSPYRSRGNKQIQKADTNTKAVQKPDTSNQQLSPQTSVPDEKKRSSGAARAKRLPADWFLPKSWGEWALQNRPGITQEQIRLMADTFKDYWIAKAGSSAAKLDWEATWRNWVRRDSQPWSKPGGPRDYGAEMRAAGEKAREILFGKKTEKDVTNESERL